MTDLLDRLTVHLNKLAETASATHDFDAVQNARRPGQGTSLSPNRLSGRNIARAAAVVLAVGSVGVLATRQTTSESSPAQDSPVPTTQAALPVMPGSSAGTALLVECIRGRGLDVAYDEDNNGQPGITFDTRVVTAGAFDEAHAACTVELVLGHEIYGLGPDAPSGPGVAVTPGSPEGTKLLGDCLLAAGIAVTFDGGGIAYDNREVSDEDFDAASRACTDQLVAEGLLVPL